MKPGDRMEFVNLAAEVKATGDGGEFVSLLSTEAVDREGESIAFGAFEPLPASVPLYHSHDWRDGALPVGRGTPYYEGRSLKIAGRFASTPRAQELRTLVREGVVDSMSVGFIHARRSDVKGQRTVTKGELIEGSFTAVPVNPTATVLSAKSVADLKAGARNSASDLALIQTMHDTAVDLGAACPGSAKSIDDGDVAMRARALRMVAEAAIGRAAEDPVTPTDLDLQARIIAIDALAAEHGINTRRGRR